jgi:hypothetical protein
MITSGRELKLENSLASSLDENEQLMHDCVDKQLDM